MEHIASLNNVNERLKKMEGSMATRDELNRILETVVILSNAATMKQIRASERDIEAGRVKELKKGELFR